MSPSLLGGDNQIKDTTMRKRKKIKVELNTVYSNDGCDYLIKVIDKNNGYILINTSDLNDVIRALCIMRANLDQLPLDFR